MKAIEPFSGFSPETFRFFHDIKENNYKPWFDEHKLIYETEVLQPVRSLVLAMTPAMYSIDSQMDFRPQKIVSRIYRDIRFSPDKSPYKTCTWITFQRITPNWDGFPGFFWEISETGYQYGMGLFMAKKKIMDRYRDAVEYDADGFKKITEKLIAKQGFLFGGDEYKRPVPNDLPEYFQAWLQRKTIYLYKNQPVGKELFDENFARYLSDEFLALQDFYNFLVDICE
jgi:uncharacterized protein (TIGR02453 family)